MPISSVFSEYTFHNLGPLTTTWTAPASCATSVGDVRIGITQRPGRYLYDASCQVPDYSCVPTGTSADLALATNPNPTDLFQAAYFSPGLYCPSGWTTAGLASRSGTASVTWSGIFSPFGTTAIPTSIDAAFLNSPANLLLQLLDPSETAMICCPSSMTAGPWIGCYSTLPDYKFTTGCENGIPVTDLTAIERTFWFEGQTVEASVYTLVGTEPLTHPLSVTFEASYTSTLVAYSVLPFVTMIHKPVDYSAVATAEATATSNAAVRLSSTTGSWDTMGTFFAVTVLSIVMGAAIILV